MKRVFRDLLLLVAVLQCGDVVMAAESYPLPYGLVVQATLDWVLESGFIEMPDGTVHGMIERVMMGESPESDCEAAINYDTDLFFGDFPGNHCFVYVVRMDHTAYSLGRQYGRWMRVTPAHEISLIHERTVVESVLLQRCAPDDDDDHDGVPFAVEYERATNPFSADSDGDGADDFIEVYGTNITLMLTSGHVTVNTLGTDPWLRDSDNDGVPDGLEVYGLTPYGFVTDPNNPDTDGDSVIDGLDPNPLGATDANGDGVADEWVAFWTNQGVLWGFDPAMIAALRDPDGDADGDGISNRAEYQQGSVPIVTNGHYEVRIVPSPLIITAAPNAMITAAFDVVNLSWQSGTGTLMRLSQPWFEKVNLQFANYKLPFDDEGQPQWCARFGVRVPCVLVINTTNLAGNTIYRDTLRATIGGVTTVCDVVLYVSPGAQPNHAPYGLTLSTPANGTRLASVLNQRLIWSAAHDDDGDALIYNVHCGWSGVEPPALMQEEVSATNVLAIGVEDELADCLSSNRVYSWQVEARDSHGAQCWSPVWTFRTPVADADGDGLFDDDEALLGTDKYNPDSDGDGVYDGEEYYRGANPLDRFDQPVQIDPRPLRRATLTYAYYDELRAAYGAPDYVWSQAGWGLPRGLAITPEGIVTGMPATAGTYTFRVRVRDQRSDSTETNFTLEVEARGTGPAGVIGHGVLGHGRIGD